MALAKITYEDKLPLNENATIDPIYKVQHSDMNEIKSVINGIVDQVENIDTSMIENLIKNAILENSKKEHPVGSILMSTSSANPSTYLGFGTWELWGAGKVPIGVDSSNTAINAADKTTGNASVSISHTHSVPKQDITSGSTTPNNTGAASGNTDSTTPGATGSTTPGATGAASGNTGSTTPGATGAASGSTASTTLTTAMIPKHGHGINWNTFISNCSFLNGQYAGGGGNWVADGQFAMSAVRNMPGTGFPYAISTGNIMALPTIADTGGDGGHSHGLNSHTHTSAAHTHTLNSHTHTSAAHTHTSAAHSHGLGSHTHTSAAHSHSVTVAASTSGSAGGTVSLYQPSIACYMWKRTA